MIKEELGAFDIGSLRPEELESWYAFCGRIFSSTGTDYFRAHYMNDPDAHCEDIFVARKDGEIVSSVRLFTRSAWVNGRVARVGGIGEVCSEPSIRGLGVSTHLLNLARERMDARGWELGMLYTGRHSHYARVGFERTVKRFKLLNPAELPEVGEGVQVRPFEAGDLDAVMGLFDLYTSQFDLALRREKRAYWEKWVLSSWKNPTVLVQEGQVKAYADVQAHDGNVLHVRETGAIPGEDETLGMLLRACAARLGCEKLHLSALVLPALAGEEQKLSEGLIVRMASPALGFSDCGELITKTAPHLLQWDTDGF